MIRVRVTVKVKVRVRVRVSREEKGTCGVEGGIMAPVGNNGSFGK